MPTMPPTCKNLKSIRNSQVQILQLPLPSFGPGSVFIEVKVGLPVTIACLPNSTCTATFTKQLTKITHRAMNPAFAPRVVVATSSPDPTIDADSTNPGPRCLRLPRRVVGGSSILDGSSR